MREILFRGKRIDNGEWVEGYYLVKAEKGLIWDRGNIQLFEVILESVGQFTGLTDKDWNKIFEGDLVESEDYLPSEVSFYDGSFHFWDMPVEDAFGKEWKIIGNIHDNPELIK